MLRLLPFLLLGCHQGPKHEQIDIDTVVDSGPIEVAPETDTSPETVADTAGEDTATVPVDPTQATVRGRVSVQLYTEDDSGIRSAVSWDEATDGEYTLGSIFIASWSGEDASDIEYYGTDAVQYETVDVDNGNEYEITVSIPDDADSEIYLYATVDQGRDGILATGEPVGVYPDPIAVVDGETYTDADIVVMVPHGASSGTVNEEGGTDWTGGEDCDAVTLSGDLTTTDSYTSGDGVAMLLDQAGNGPYYYDWVSLAGDSDGASGGYAMVFCPNLGSWSLRGAWDSNGNSLIDPTDSWGSYANQDGVDANPVNIGTVDLPGRDILIPLGSSGLGLVPYARLSGELSVSDGTFDDLIEGTTTLYVVAMKYRPTTGMSVSSLLDQAYDVEIIDAKKLQGKETLSWSLGVPAQTAIYLWAYADSGSIGTINESGEYIASGGDDDDGMLVTTAGSDDGHDLALGLAAW